MMKNKIKKTKLLFYFFIVLIFTFTQFSLPGHAEELSEPIILGKHYDIFRDPSNKITIEDLLSGTYNKSFVASKDDYVFFSHTNDTIWLRLDTEKILKDKQDSYWLEVTDKLDSIEMYLVKEDGSYRVQKRGISNVDDQNIHYRSNLFQIKEPSVKEIYLKLDGELPLSSISFLFATDSFINKIIDYKYLTGMFYGFLLALLIYNLFLFFSLKEKAYFYYVLYIFSFILYQATLNSLDVELLGQFLPKWFFIKSSAISGNLLLLFMILFCKEFLELKKYLPRFHNFGNLLLWGTVLSLIASFIIPDVAITNNITIILAVVVFIFLWLSGIFVLLKGQKMARYYMVGWTILLGSIIVQALALLSIIPFHPVIFEEVPAVGAIFESIFLSLALGDKINIIKKETQEIQQILNETLEYKVKERTQELERAKLELEKLANTDRLTQVPNRVRLDYVLEEAFEQAQHHETKFSIILLDIDYFKEVNDEFGHQVGDLVLMNVAQILQNTIREQDTVGRWGGEEFLVICPQTTLDEAVKVSEKIRQQLENYQFPIVQRKTSSFGVTSYVNGDTRNTLLSRCDKALYRAKERGRNCVEFLIDDVNDKISST